MQGFEEASLNDLLHEELADLLCSGMDQFIIAQQQNSITQKKVEKK